MRSIAPVKSASVTASAPRRVASSAASLTRLARSAPVKPGVSAATVSSVDVGAELDLLDVHLAGSATRPGLVGPVDQDLAVEAAGAQQRRVEDLRAVGRGQQHDAARRGRSRRARRAAGSASAPSRRGRRPSAEAPRARPSASSSSMKMMQGAFLRACSNRSRTRAAPTPTNISTNSEPRDREERHAGLARDGRASSVLPVPGGPTSSMPLGSRRAEPAVALRVLQEGDDLLQLGLGLVDAGDVGEGDLGVLLDVDLGLALADRHQPAEPLPCPAKRRHHEHPDAEEQQPPAAPRTGGRADRCSRRCRRCT